MTDSLRTDERSWLIYDDESVGAVVRGMEAYALSVTGQKLSKHPDQTIRAVGEAMIQLGEHRGWEMLNNGGAQAVATHWFAMLGMHISGFPHDEVKCEQARDELQAVMFHVTRRAKAMGRTGPGVIREAIRGD